MSINETKNSLKLRVGIFSLLGLLLVGAVTVLVNDKPYWWRGCNPVYINIEDATGLKTKSPVRSLGLQIGYLSTIALTESHVRLGICITAPVAVTAETRAFIRGEGFLGDKFVELKPVHYEGNGPTKVNAVLPAPIYLFAHWTAGLDSVFAEGDSTSKDIPVGREGKDVQQLVDQVNHLVGELTSLTTSIKSAINPNDLRNTMVQLNKTLENAAKTLSPEGNLTTTAQRTLSKLEDSIEQLRSIMTRVNQGEGTVGKFLTDPGLYDELVLAAKNINQLLSKVNGMRFIVDVGGEKIPAYDGSRSGISVAIWPRKNRYYLLGISVDPRGKSSKTQTVTTVNGTSTTTETTQTEEGGLLLTGKLGVVYWNRLDLSIGVLYGDGCVSAGLYLGAEGEEDRIQLVNDIYARTIGAGTSAQIHARSQLKVFPFGSPYLTSVYVKGGMESYRRVNDKVAYSFGAGVSFDDQDIKMLFSFL